MGLDLEDYLDLSARQRGQVGDDLLGDLPRIATEACSAEGGASVEAPGRCDPLPTVLVAGIFSAVPATVRLQVGSGDVSPFGVDLGQGGSRANQQAVHRRGGRLAVHDQSRIASAVRVEGVGVTEALGLQV